MSQSKRESFLVTLSDLTGPEDGIGQGSCIIPESRAWVSLLSQGHWTKLGNYRLILSPRALVYSPFNYTSFNIPLSFHTPTAAPAIAPASRIHDGAPVIIAALCVAVPLPVGLVPLPPLDFEFEVGVELELPLDFVDVVFDVWVVVASRTSNVAV